MYIYIYYITFQNSRKVSIVKSTSRSSNRHVANFQRKIQLSGFSACPDGSPSHVIQSSIVLMQLGLVEERWIKLHA